MNKKERSKLLRSAVYTIDENWKGRMPNKNVGDDLQKEIAYCKELENVIGSDQTLSSIPTVKEKLNLLKETLGDTKDNLVLSKEADAKTGHKSADSSFFGYKTHIAVTEERIITAAIVTSGEKGDRSGYHYRRCRLLGKENLKLAGGQNIKVVARSGPVITQGFRKDEDKFDYNKDADMFVCPAGHLAIRKARHGKKIGRNQNYTYYFDVEKCRSCPLNNGCYRPNMPFLKRGCLY